MKNSYQALLSICFAAILAACGGGGGGSAPAAVPTGPVPGAAPTAVIPNSQAAANALAGEARSSFAAAAKMQAASSLPGGVNFLFLPAGVEQACPGGGNYSFTEPTSNAPGTTFTITFNNCALVVGEFINGTVTTRLDTFVDDANFSFTSTFNITSTGIASAITGSTICNIANNVATCYFTDGTHTFETSFSLSAGVINGAYQWVFQTLGTVLFTFSNWTTTGGTITVTGANGTSATIVHSLTNLVVTIGTTPYTVPAP